MCCLEGTHNLTDSLAIFKPCASVFFQRGDLQLDQITPRAEHETLVDWLNRASPIKPRHRRTKAAMDTIRQSILDIVIAGNGMTVRHLFYRLVGASVIEKTEHEYQSTVARLAVELRRSGDIPYGRIVDGSRLYTAPNTYDSVKDAIADTASSYRRSYWRTADRQLEVWCEKDAIRALIEDTTWRLAVPLMVTRGFASESIVQSLAMDTLRSKKPRVILSLNDYDPSGSIMLADIIKRAKHYAPDAVFHCEQVALTRQQVTRYKLPTRPTKLEGNRHASNFTDPESVELDALAPEILQNLVGNAIDAHIDNHALGMMQVAERSERKALKLFSVNWQQEQEK
jgi:hypothetical protein